MRKMWLLIGVLIWCGGLVASEAAGETSWIVRCVREFISFPEGEPGGPIGQFYAVGRAANDSALAECVLKAHDQLSQDYGKELQAEVWNAPEELCDTLLRSLSEGWVHLLEPFAQNEQWKGYELAEDRQALDYIKAVMRIRGLCCLLDEPTLIADCLKRLEQSKIKSFIQRGRCRAAMKKIIPFDKLSLSDASWDEVYGQALNGKGLLAGIFPALCALTLVKYIGVLLTKEFQILFRGISTYQNGLGILLRKVSDKAKELSEKIVASAGHVSSGLLEPDLDAPAVEEFVAFEPAAQTSWIADYVNALVLAKDGADPGLCRFYVVDLCGSDAVGVVKQAHAQTIALLHKQYGKELIALGFNQPIFLCDSVFVLIQCYAASGILGEVKDAESLVALGLEENEASKTYVRYLLTVQILNKLLDSPEPVYTALATGANSKVVHFIKQGKGLGRQVMAELLGPDLLAECGFDWNDAYQQALGRKGPLRDVFPRLCTVALVHYINLQLKEEQVLYSQIEESYGTSQRRLLDAKIGVCLDSLRLDIMAAVQKSAETKPVLEEASASAASLSNLVAADCAGAVAVSPTQYRPTIVSRTFGAMRAKCFDLYPSDVCGVEYCQFECALMSVLVDAYFAAHSRDYPEIWARHLASLVERYQPMMEGFSLKPEGYESRFDAVKVARLEPYQEKPGDDAVVTLPIVVSFVLKELIRHDEPAVWAALSVYLARAEGEVPELAALWRYAVNRAIRNRVYLRDPRKIDLALLEQLASYEKAYDYCSVDSPLYRWACLSLLSGTRTLFDTKPSHNKKPPLAPIGKHRYLGCLLDYDCSKELSEVQEELHGQYAKNAYELIAELKLRHGEASIKPVAPVAYAGVPHEPSFEAPQPVHEEQDLQDQQEPIVAAADALVSEAMPSDLIGVQESSGPLLSLEAPIEEHGVLEPSNATVLTVVAGEDVWKAFDDRCCDSIGKVKQQLQAACDISGARDSLVRPFLRCLYSFVWEMQSDCGDENKFLLRGMAVVVLLKLASHAFQKVASEFGLGGIKVREYTKFVSALVDCLPSEGMYINEYLTKLGSDLERQDFIMRSALLPPAALDEAQISSVDSLLQGDGTCLGEELLGAGWHRQMHTMPEPERLGMMRADASEWIPGAPVLSSARMYSDPRYTSVPGYFGNVPYFPPYPYPSMPAGIPLSAPVHSVPGVHTPLPGREPVRGGVRTARPLFSLTTSSILPPAQKKEKE